MSDPAAVSVRRWATYRNASPYPFCPGCGHGSILDRLDEALVELAVDPRRVVLVSDIGCSGLSDQYFDTHAFHGLHGRSITYASGIKLADPALIVVVLMGDGGVGIGGGHLLAAARRNLDLTLLIFNNFNFGMTGGQHSSTTPTGAITSTTPHGHLERPLDIGATVAAGGAGFVYRGTSFDPDLAKRIAEGVRHPGFAVLDIWEPCTAYYAPRNHLTRKAIFQQFDELGFAAGFLRRVEPPEFGASYRATCTGEGAGALAPQAVAARFESALERPFRLVLAGSAGERVGTAARLLARAAMLCGLHVALRSDYPVTVKTGHSLAELIFSPEPIEYAAIERPDALVVLSEPGRRQVQRYRSRLDSGTVLFAVAGCEPADLPAPVVVLDPAGSAGRTAGRLPRDGTATAVAAAVARHLDLVPAEALTAAAAESAGETGTIPLAVAVGLAMAGDASAAVAAPAAGNLSEPS